MAIQQTTIFNSNLASNSENLSSVFSTGLGFYLIAPASALEYQIDVYLQVQVSNTETRQIRLDPLNVSTTQRVTLIPPQIVEFGLPMRLAIVPSQEFLLEVILLQTDCSVCGLDAQLAELKTLVEDLAANSSSDIADLLLTLSTQLLQFDAGLFTVAQGLSRLLPTNQGRNLRRNTARRLALDRNFL